MSALAAQANSWLHKGEYAKAAGAFQTLYDQASQSNDRAYMDGAQGGLGLSYAALGELGKAFDYFSASAEQAASDGQSDLYAKSEYNAALLQARIANLVPVNLLWVPRLRHQAIVNPAPDDVALVEARAYQAYANSDPATTSDLNVEARVLAVNYAYGAMSDDKALQVLTTAANTAFAAHDQNDLLAIADSAIGRLAFRQSPGLTELAFRSLQAVSSGAAINLQTKAVGLLGRLYALENRQDDALALTGEANLLAAKSQDSSLQLEFMLQYAVIAEQLGQVDTAQRAYDRVDDLIQALQAALSPQMNFEQKADLRILMSIALDAQVDLILSKSGTPSDAELRKARTLLELSKVIDFENYFSTPCLESSPKHKIGIDAFDPYAAVIYPILFDDHAVIIVSTAKTIQRFTVPESRYKIVAAAQRFRAGVRDTKSAGDTDDAEYLYNVLVAPEADLMRSSGVKTLIFSPSSDLRGLPIEALYDGKDYLIVHYAVATALALNLVDTTGLDRQHPQALLAGISESRDGMLALPNVDVELQSVSQVLKGPVLLNSQFTSRSLMTETAQTQPNIIHIASHGLFKNLAEDNFILAYDRKLTWVDIKSLVLSSREHGIDLLTLSACETAAGNDDALLGLAGIAYQTGARSVLGTLWPVSDKGSSKLMAQFYDGVFNKGLSRAEALRQAQISLLADSETSHPGIWAAYIIVGNWQ